MNAAIIAAIATGTCTIVAAVLAAAIHQGWIQNPFRRRVASPPRETGKITEAVRKKERPTVVDCSGWIDGYTGDGHIWLATQIGDLIWPKEPAIHPDATGRWIQPVNEGGTAKRIEITIWFVDNRSNLRITKWLSDCHRAQSYPGLSPLPGMRRLDAVAVELT